MPSKFNLIFQSTITSTMETSPFCWILCLCSLRRQGMGTYRPIPWRLNVHNGALPAIDSTPCLRAQGYVHTVVCLSATNSLLGSALRHRSSLLDTNVSHRCRTCEWRYDPYSFSLTALCLNFCPLFLQLKPQPALVRIIVMTCQPVPRICHRNS